MKFLNNFLSLTDKPPSSGTALTPFLEKIYNSSTLIKLFGRNLFIFLMLFILGLIVFYSDALAGSTLTAPILNYPNPFSPPSQPTTICYSLSENADINIYIFDITNHLTKKFSLKSGSNGGIAGINNITWEGVSEVGDVVSNGVYILKIIASGKLIGKSKIAVLK